MKVSQFGQNGSEVILRLSGPGELLGALGLCSGGTHCSTAQALQSLKHSSGKLRFLSLSWSAFQSCDAILDATKKVAPRLGSQLVRLLNQIGRTVNGGVEISLSREELAQLTGMTLFTVSRLICQWEQQGIVAARRKAVLVRNLPALIELSEAD